MWVQASPISTHVPHTASVAAWQPGWKQGRFPITTVSASSILHSPLLLLSGKLNLSYAAWVYIFQFLRLPLKTAPQIHWENKNQEKRLSLAFPLKLPCLYHFLLFRNNRSLFLLPTRNYFSTCAVNPHSLSKPYPC